MAYKFSDKVEECQNSSLNKHSVDWLSLPEDIYSLIADKVIHIRDYTRFGAVCTLWQSVYVRNRNNLIREPLLLMVPTEHDQDGQSRSLYSLYENKIYKNLKVALPHNRHCCGSSHGWLVTVSENYQVCLVNPFLPPNTEIQLPPLTDFPLDRGSIYRPTFLKKAVLSADPNSNPNYVVMVIYDASQRMSFFKSGDKTWTHLAEKTILDVIVDQNKFYALCGDGYVLAYDANDPSSANPEMLGGERKDKRAFGHCRYYLVKSSATLFQVIGYVHYDGDSDEELEDAEEVWEDHPIDYLTDKFEILKLDPGSRHWNDSVDSLDGKVLFVGDNSSLCLSVSDMPGCKPNCIYFTDDNHSGYFRFRHKNFGPRDVGVYCLEDKTIEPFYLTDSKTFAVAPIFIQPTATRLSC